jgi:putative transposase
MFSITPFNKLIPQIQYKAEEVGIIVILTEESYTSKVDHLALEPMCHHEKYLGRRVHRGLFKSSTGVRLNADINGAIGILRKVIGDDFITKLDRGQVPCPVRINVLANHDQCLNQKFYN